MPGNKEEISFVVLAGGASSRMGTDKADLMLNGRTFLQHQLDKAEELGVRDILVSGYRGNRCQALNVADRIPGKGPMSGMEACFRRADHEWCLVLSIDVPFVSIRDLSGLIDRAADSSLPAVLLEHDGKIEPLIGMYRVCLADRMEQSLLDGRGSVLRMLGDDGYERYHSSSPETDFLNINDPDTYKQAVRDE